MALRVDNVGENLQIEGISISGYLQQTKKTRFSSHIVKLDQSNARAWGISPQLMEKSLSLNTTSTLMMPVLACQGVYIYPIPVMTMSKLKLVIPVMLDEIARVKVSFKTAPGSTV